MKNLIAKCKSANAQVATMLDRRDISIDDWIRLEGNKLKSNNLIKPLLDKKDFIDICSEYMRVHFPDVDRTQVEQSFYESALGTANHLGGLYSPQSFQGDLFFGRLLEQQNEALKFIPILSFGCVPINSSTYARGLIAYTEKDSPIKIPIFPKNPPNPVASLISPFDASMIKRATDRAYNQISSYLVKKTMKSFISEVYLSKETLSCKSFSDQAVLISRAIYDRIPSLTNGLTYCHLHAEELFAELFIRDIKNRHSPLPDMLSNNSFIRIINELTDEENRTLSSLLFRGCDKENRFFVLNLCNDNVLRGTTIDGIEQEIPFETEIITAMLRQKKLLVDVYLSFLMTGFLRGFTWYGGIFQSLYLPCWHNLTLQALKAAGYADILDAGKDYDFSGYISGPICMLFGNDDFAVPAGPLEIMAKTPSESDYHCYLGTDMKSAHEMDLYEFYNDLIPACQKEAGWYEKIASYERKNYEKNIL